MDSAAAPRLVRVRIRGASSRTAAVTWGQAAIWASIRAMGPDGAYFNLRRVVVPDGRCPADEAVRRVHRVVTALDCLRTRFPVEGGRPRQVVDGEGELAVTVVEVAPDEVDDAVTATTTALRADPIEAAAGWPVRFGVVATGGECRALVVVVSHLAVDAAGLDLLAAALRTGEVPAGGWQPCDQATTESTPKEQRRSALNVARWTGLLAGLDPPPPVPEPVGRPADTRFAEWSMVSGPLRRSAQELAGRCEVSYSSAVLAAVVAVLGRERGQPDVALTLISRNRSRPREQGYAGPLAQDALFRVGWDGGAPAAEFVRAVHREAVAAYAGARYDPDRLREQGVAKVPFFFNDARGAGSGADPAPGAGPDTEQVEQVGSWPYLDLRRFFTLQDAGDRARLRVVLDTWTDTGTSGPELLRAVSATAARLAPAPQRPLSALLHGDAVRFG